MRAKKFNPTGNLHMHTDERIKLIHLPICGFADSWITKASETPTYNTKYTKISFRKKETINIRKINSIQDFNDIPEI